MQILLALLIFLLKQSLINISNWCNLRMILYSRAVYTENWFFLKILIWGSFEIQNGIILTYLIYGLVFHNSVSLLFETNRRSVNIFFLAEFTLSITCYFLSPYLYTPESNTAFSHRGPRTSCFRFGSTP
jgi:hypothetical protein